MNKRKANLSQPPALHQKGLIQSILRFVPLQEAMLSANVCKSWHNAHKSGLKFHPERLTLIKFKYEDDWGIQFQNFTYQGHWGLNLPNFRCYNLDDIPEPRRSHILEIIDRIYFTGSTWPEAITNLAQMPQSQMLKELSFEYVAPTQHEFLELLAKIDVTNVEEVRFDEIQFSSTPIEHIVNRLPSLKKANFLLCDSMVDFKQMKPIETVLFHVEDETPNLEGKVKVLEIADDVCMPMVAFNLDSIQGVEKMILHASAIGEEKFELRCEEICFKLASARETSLKTFVIKSSLPDVLQRIFEEPRYHDVDGWSCSLSNGEVVFKRIEK